MFYEYINLIFTLGTIIINFLSQYGFINKKTISLTSNKVNTILTPSKWTFSIWIIIYIFQLAFNIYSLIYVNEITRRLNIFPVLVNISNILWVLSFSYDFYVLSTIILFAMLSFLIEIYILLEVYYSKNMFWEELIFYFIPFSIYLGWVLVATILSFVYTINVDYDNLYEEKNQFLNIKEIKDKGILIN